MNNNNIINSFIGQPGALHGVAGSRKQQEKRDMGGDLDRSFAKLLEEEETRPGAGSKDTAREVISEDPKTEEQKKNADKKDVDKGAAAKKDIEQQLKEKLTKMSSMLNYLYNLMYKNPDALTMMEKKAAGMDKVMERHDVEYKEFKKMLSDKGLKMSDLSFDQMAKLAQRKTKSQISTYLDQILKEKNLAGEKPQEKATLVEKGKEAMAKRMGDDVAGQKPQSMNDLKQALDTKQTTPQDQAHQALKKQEVIDQIIKHVDIRNVNERTELVMKLNPEYLGDLKMKVNFQEGKLSALFETTSKEVRDMLNESGEELTNVFNDKGLKLVSSKASLVDIIE